MYQKVATVNNAIETVLSELGIEILAIGDDRRPMLSLYCRETGISRPGKNFVNIDKSLFMSWKESRS